MTPPVPSLAAFPLTPRERDVAGAMARGLEIKEIARELGIGYQTTKMHIRGVKAKLGARNQLEVVILAYGGIPQSMAGTVDVQRPIEQAPAWPRPWLQVARR